jgi:ABC-type uncharacterized transport system permease subunit
LIASFPTRLLIEALEWSLLLHVIVVTAAAFGAVLFFWRTALKSYSSASS